MIAIWYVQNIFACRKLFCDICNKLYKASKMRYKDDYYIKH